MSNALTAFPELDVNQAQSPNLLGMASGAASLIGQLNQNRQFGAQQVQSRLLTQNTNPDGTINVPGYQAAVAENPQAASVGAGDAYAQAQELNAKSLANTGMSLGQHYTRLSSLYNALQAENVSNNGAGIPAAEMKQKILDQLNQGNITPTEAATAYTDVSDDPRQNAQTIRSALAGVTQSLAAITPAYKTLETGAGTVVAQENAGAAGGAQIPNVTTGLPAAVLAQPYQWTDRNNQPHNGTVGEYLASQGVQTAPQVGGGVGEAAASQSGAPQPPLPQIGAPAPTQPGVPTTGQIAAMPSSGPAQQAPQAPPGSGGTPMAGPAPGLAQVQQQNAEAYNSDQTTATSLAPRISALQELAAAAPGANTGPEAGQLADLRGLGEELGINVGTDQASQEQAMNKATNMLVTSGVSGLGTPTDAKMLEVIGATPNSKMTPEAVKSTVAMTYGTLLYQQNLAKAGQNWIAQGGSVANYNQFKLQYQQTAPSPLVLSMPYMPPKALLAVGKYIKTLPAQDQQRINAEIVIMNQMQGGPGQ